MTYVVLILSIIGVALINCPHRPGAIIEGDAPAAYAPAIELGISHDWHSALFLTECIRLKAFMQLFGVYPSGMDILYVIWYISAAVLVFSLLYAVRTITKHRASSIIFICSAIFFLAANLRGYICYLYIDFYFAAALSVLLTSIYLTAKHHNSAKQRLILGIIFIITLYHIINLRKNAVLLLPLLLYIEGRYLFPHRGRLKHVLCSILIAIGLFLASNSIAKYALSDCKAYPMTMMLLSDLSVAANLRNDYESHKNAIIHTTGYEIKPQQKLFAAAIPYDSKTLKQKYGDKPYSQLIRLYAQAWREHPESLIDAKLIQITQFYLGGYTPKFLIEYYENKYKLKGKMRAEFAQPLRWKDFISISARLVVESIALIYTLFLIIKLLSKNKPDTFSKGVLYTMLLAEIYALSYIIVTPTPDFRYRFASTLICTFASAIALNELWHWLHKRSQLSHLSDELKECSDIQPEKRPATQKGIENA